MRDGVIYQGYGLELQSRYPLPELETVESPRAPADVTIEFESGTPSAKTAITRESGQFGTGFASFDVADGTSISVTLSGDASVDRTRPYLFGPALSLLLYQRGLFQLHGCTVAIGERAVVLLGESGAGKSTLAAALYDRGHGLVTDDIAVVEPTPDGPTVRPGFPACKLHPADAAAVLDTLTAHDIPESPKRYYKLPDRFPSTPLPLDGIYVLAEAPQLDVERLDSQLAIRELLRHSYRPRIVEEMGLATERLHQFSDVVERTPVKRLHRPKDYQSLADVAGLIERDTDYAVAR